MADEGNMEPGVEHTGREIHAETRTEVPAERVWEAWADPDRIAEWFVDRAEGPVEEGGTYTWFWDAFGFELPHDVLVARPPERLVLRAAGRGVRMLEVTISADGGETVIRLVDSGFREGGEWDEEYRATESGWTQALAILKHYVEAHFGERRTELLVRRPAEFEYAELAPHYHTAEGLAGWLVREADVGAVGDPVSWTLWDGRPLSGRILARTAFEMSVSWEEEDAVLELKAFPHGEDRRAVALRLSGWRMDEPSAERLESWLEASVERLASAVSTGG